MAIGVTGSRDYDRRDESRTVEAACLACDGVEGARPLCRDCASERAVEAAKVEDLVREVEDYARALHLVRWTPERTGAAVLERELGAAMSRLRVLLGGRL